MFLIIYSAKPMFCHSPQCYHCLFYFRSYVLIFSFLWFLLFGNQVSVLRPSLITKGSELRTCPVFDLIPLSVFQITMQVNFLMLAFLVEYNFLTTFYGLYFNYQFTHYIYNFFKFLHVSYWPSVGSFHVLHQYVFASPCFICTKLEY